MSDLICRKTMMRCPTPGTCSPHGGCQSQHDRDSSELRRLCAERNTLRTTNQRLEGEVKRLREIIDSALEQFPFNADRQRFTFNGQEVTADGDDLFYSVKRVNAFLCAVNDALSAKP